MGLYPNHIKTAIFASNSAYFTQILSYIQNFCSTFCNVTYFKPQLIFRHQLRFYSGNIFIILTNFVLKYIDKKIKLCLSISATV